MVKLAPLFNVIAGPPEINSNTSLSKFNSKVPPFTTKALPPEYALLLFFTPAYI